eukprot:scaffold50407_cov33-Phaeocystis_antarctica.AAC.1
MDAFDLVSKERVNTLRPACRGCRSCRQSSGCRGPRLLLAPVIGGPGEAESAKIFSLTGVPSKDVVTLYHCLSLLTEPCSAQDSSVSPSC